MIISVATVAHAAELYDIPPTSSGSWGGETGFGAAKIAREYTPAEDQVVCSVGFYVARNPTYDPVGTISYEIYSDTGGNPDAGTLLASASADIETDLDYTSGNPSFATAKALDTCVNMTASTTYWILADATPASLSTNQLKYGYATTAGYDWAFWRESIGWTTSGGNQELSITLEGAAGGTDTIAFTNPTDSEALDTDFAAWTFDYTLANATTSTDIYIGVDIDYVASSTGNSFHETIDSYITASEAGSGGSVLTYKDALLAPDTYTATSTLYSILIDQSNCVDPPSEFELCTQFDQFGSSTLATDNITFSTAGFASYFDPNTSTSTISNLNATCDAASNFFAESLCKMMITVFVPSEASLNRFDSIGDLITSKPPVGYFTQFKTAFTDYASGTLATAAISFDENIQDFSPISTLRAALGWVFWFVFGFWVFHRLRHFDFHS